MGNPVDDYFEDKEKTAAERNEIDLQHFHKWKAEPTKTNLSNLIGRFDSEINRGAHSWKAPAVPLAAFKADLKKNAINAFETFDPNRGASLRTHVNNILRRSQRFNAKYQNVAFIPEEKAALITPIKKARDSLFDELGQQPTHGQIASFLNRQPELLPRRVQGKLTASLIKTVDKYQIRDIPGGAFESDPTPKMMSFQSETLELLRPSLKPDEQIVYDFLFGKNGKPKVESTGEIARRIGKSPSQVSRLKKRIEATYKKYA
jgi:DNA-directed RNA polymerase specialized sigma subunit